MTETTTAKPLKVIGSDTEYPCLIVLAEQYDDVAKVLDAHGFRYWRSAYNISINHDPFTATIHFEPRTDGQKVQAILDAH